MRTVSVVLSLLVILLVLGAGILRPPTPGQAAQAAAPGPAAAQSTASVYCPIFPPGSGPTYNIFDLGTLGGASSEAYDINSLGQIAGWSHTAGGASHAVLWDSDSMTDLGALGSSSIAYAVSDAGVIAGWSDGQAVRWMGGPGPIGLGYLPGGTGSAAFGVSPNGIIVGRSSAAGTPYWRAFRYGGGMVALGAPADAHDTRADDRNRAGLTVGTAVLHLGGGAYAGRAARWFGGGMPVDLGVLAGQEPAHNYSLATAINDRGEIVGDSYGDATGVFREPFLFRGGAMSELLPGFNATCPYGNAFDINNAGQVVGLAGSTSFRTPTLWMDGNVYFLHHQVLNLDDWQLKEARAINDAGMIAGYGVRTDSGATHAFLLLPTVATDLSAERLEVTQSVQDLNNRVELVKNKRTFVRFYVRATGEPAWSYARLKAQRGANIVYLEPINPGAHVSIGVGDPLDRRPLLDSTFLFELPAGFREGTVELTAEVNPLLAWRGRAPLEEDYSNNESSLTVDFRPVPELDLRVFSVGYYTHTGGTLFTPGTDPLALSQWLRRAYPIHSLNVSYHEITMTLPISMTGSPGFTCVDVNAELRNIRTRAGAGEGETRYYGMVDDGGAFMRGCAELPGHIGSGPTGDPAGQSDPLYTWDKDTTYGDWYGGHELGHTLGRFHISVLEPDCQLGMTHVMSFTNPFGRISPVLAGVEAMFGFDSKIPKEVYGPAWKDMMTYCPNQWISDVNYTEIMTEVIDNFAPVIPVAPVAGLDRLLVQGVIYPDGAVSLYPLFVIPEADDMEPNLPGPYAIVLRDADGEELARYPFTPDGMVSEDGAGLLVISELLPYLPGMERLDIEGPGGALLTSVTAGPTPPEVTLTGPPAGAHLPAGDLTVTWEAEDADGDPLTFDLEYSPDGGDSWSLVAPHLTGGSVVVSEQNLPAGDEARFRIWVTDGIHTNGDVGAPFTVANHPPTAEIIEPAVWGKITISQTLGLVGQAYDIELGTPDNSALTWSSDLQGVLGHGPELSVTGLMTGTHTITFEVDDGEETATDSVMVTVVSTPMELPYADDALLAAPEPIILLSTGEPVTQTLSIANLNVFRPLTWEAADNRPWLTLDLSAGSTPGAITVTFDPAGLIGGSYSGTITLTSPELPGFSLPVAVKVNYQVYRMLLPVVMR